MEFMYRTSIRRLLHFGNMKSLFKLKKSSSGYRYWKQIRNSSSSTSQWNSPPSRILPLRVDNKDNVEGAIPITNSEFSDRRSALMKRVCGMFPQNPHIIIMPGIPKRYMVEKIPFLFRQETDMRYLTGCEEPDCVLVIHSEPGKSYDQSKSLIFCSPYDPGLEKWEGPRTSPQAASQVWGVDQGVPLHELEMYLTKLAPLKPIVWYSVNSPNPNIHKMLLKFLSGSLNIQNPKSHLHQMRLIKSPAEIKLMKEACRISSEAIKDTMKSTKVPTSEHELFATVDYHCRMKGGDHLAYPPVVAGGARANTIHYTRNNQPIRNNEMVLMDAGAEYRGYSGDVTRTWPVSGRFSVPQKMIYQAVLEVQKHMFDACTERPSVDKLFSIMCVKMGQVLQELMLLPANLPADQLARGAFGFCPHHVSHYLGMDIHDTAFVDKSLPIQPGSIITIEPGIYISETNTAVSPHFAGIGVRLEDDILITDTGIEILTKSCPKEIDEVENIVGSDYT